MRPISVILPVKNGADHVQQAIQSILSQTFTNFQLIIINDSSADNTWSILKNFTDERIVLLNNPDPGLVNSLNLGLKHADGEFIARMDADDIALPERLAKQFNFLCLNKEIGVASCLVEPLPLTGNNNGYAFHVAFINNIITPQEHYINRFVDSPVAHPSVMFHKSLVDKYGGYIEFTGPEDYDLWLRWLDNGVKFAKIPEVLMTWSDSPHRLSRTSRVYSRDNFFKLKANYLARWKAKNMSDTNIWIWGYGKTIFKRTALLENLGISVTGYIDVQAHPNSTRNVIHFEDYKKNMGLVLVYVSDRVGKKMIQEFMNKHGFLAGVDYYFMA